MTHKLQALTVAALIAYALCGCSAAGTQSPAQPGAEQFLAPIETLTPTDRPVASDPPYAPTLPFDSSTHVLPFNQVWARTDVKVEHTLTSYSEAVLVNGTSGDPRIDQTRPVYAVTVHEKITNDAPSGVIPKTWDVYALIIDAISGDQILSGTGISFVDLGLAPDPEPSP